MQKFVSEDDLNTFKGWMEYQGVDPTTLSVEELEMWRDSFYESQKRSSVTPKVGLMKLQFFPGEHRYAVAVREGTDLWLVLWVRRSPKGEFFVFVPRRARDWDSHTSYHLDGALHVKSHGRKVLPPTKRQPLTGTFQGTEQLAAVFGYGPKSVGAICDPTAFSGVVEVPPGVLGPKDGGVTVDLVGPGCDPPVFPWTNIARREVFSDICPSVVITIGSCG